MAFSEEELRRIRQELRRSPELRAKVRKALEQELQTVDGTIHPFHAHQPLPKQREVLMCDSRVVAFCTANQVGKSTTGGFWIATRLKQYDPLRPDRKFPRDGRYWACTHGDLIDGLMDKVLQFIPEDEIAVVRRSPGKQLIRMKDGPQVKFKSFEQSRGAYQQESLHGAWVDEEIPQHLWAELWTRCIRHRSQILFTFTPVEGTVWMHELLFSENYEGLVAVFRMSMRENIYLPTDAVTDYIRALDGDPDQIAIRVDGDYRRLSGESVFAANPDERQYLKECLEKATDPAGRYIFDEETGERTLAPDGVRYAWEVWEDPLPGERFVIGIDVAYSAGVHGDWSVALVFSVDRMRFTAMYRGKPNPYDFGTDLDLAGRYWNNALLVPEVNGPGAATVTRLQALAYPELYKRTAFSGQRRRTTSAYGFYTTAQSKQTAVQAMVTMWREGHLDIPIPRLLLEMEKFEWLKKDIQGKYGVGAALGHDDCVMSAVMAIEGLNQIRRPRKMFVDEGRRLTERLENLSSARVDEEEETWD